MAKAIEKRRVHCSVRHVGAFVIQWDNSSFTVKRGLSKTCSDYCPYLKDPFDKSEYKTAPEYKSDK